MLKHLIKGVDFHFLKFKDCSATIIQCFAEFSQYAKDSAGATQPEEPPHPLAEAPGSSSVSGRDATAAQASQPSSQSPGSNHEQSLKVDTIYSVLGEKSVDKRAEVPSGPTVSQSEEGTVIDSVYSMLQAPKTATRQ